MPDPQTALSPAGLYQATIAVALADPEERAAYARLPLQFRAVNEAVLPQDEDSRSRFLADLSHFLSAGEPGAFRVVEENLRDLYLVNIGAGHRISRKIFATHPLLPGKLLAIGGVGLVRPDVSNRRLMLQTPMHGMTLHRFFPDLPKISMSADCPTPGKGVRSAPNVDHLGGYSLQVAGTKYRHVQMITDGTEGIDPKRFPVITNVAWGTVGDDIAFYVYALPGNAIPVTELLHAQSLAEIGPALARYMGTGRKLLQALRHLHEAGYVFPQAHQGNVYVYPDARGEDQIVIADLDSMLSIRDFDAKLRQGEYLSPRAFATLVNLQIASQNIAHIAWIDFVGERTKQLQIRSFPGLDRVYVSIIADLITAYLALTDQARAEVERSLRGYFDGLVRQGMAGAEEGRGAIRLVRADLYDADVFGFLFTQVLMNAEYCRRFGARPLTEGITPQTLQQLARPAVGKGQPAGAALARAMDEAMSRIIGERSTQAMQEIVNAYQQKARAAQGT